MSVSKRKPAALGALALMTLVALVNGSQALVIEWVGRLLENTGVATATSSLVLAAGAVIGVGVVKGGALYAQVVATQRLAFRIIQDLQRAMYQSLLHADFARISGDAPGALTARFTSDVERVREGVTRSATNLGRDLLTVIVMIGVMIYLDPLLTLLVVGVYPLIFQPVLLVGRRVRRASTKAQEEMGGLASFLSESFSGARLIKAYGLERDRGAQAEAAFERRFELSTRIARGRASVEPLLEAVGAAAFAGVVAFAAWRVGNGGFPVSKILGFIAALAILAPAARAIGTLNPVIQEGLAALARVFAVLDETPAIVSRPGAPDIHVTDGRVELRDVSFDYPDGTPALSGVSMVAEPGQTTALVGPSGGGKSTVMNLIPRLFDPTSGAVLIDGVPLTDVTVDSVRAAIALVSQDAILFDDTVRANVAFGAPEADDAAIWSALDQAAARDFVEALPGGLDARVGPGGSRFSGGQRQGNALARAVVRNAPILLLDEPTSALDAQSEAHIQAALDRVSAGRTTIVIAHRLATVRRADKICVFEGGRIVETGDDASLRATPDGLYARLRALQFTEAEAPADQGAPPEPDARN